MPDDPLQPYIDDLARILKFAEDQAAKPLTGPRDPDLEKKLEQLTDMVKVFKEVCAEEIKNAGSNPENALKKFQEHPEFFTPQQQKFLRQCRDLGLTAVVLHAGLKRAREQEGKSALRQMGKNTKKSIQKRRKKFREMGGDKWTKL